jgi:pimeloyl-ACP methyl ester carboxylesterase
MRWLCTTIVIAAFFVAAGITLCEGALHVRRRVQLSPPAFLRNLAWRDAAITAADGVVLKAWFLEPPPLTREKKARSGKCVAVLHGIGDTRMGAVGFAPLFLRHGYAVLTPDSRGHGESGGEIVTYGVREAGDVLLWAGWMRSQGCSEVVGLGESLGAAILLQSAGLRPGISPPFRAIVAECSYSSFPAIARERLARGTGLPPFAATIVVWPALFSGVSWARLRYGIDLWQVNPAEAAHRSSIPILLIHGLNDDRTSPQNSRAIAAADPLATLWLVPGAGHVRASAADPAGFEARVFDFLEPSPQKNQK